MSDPVAENSFAEKKIIIVDDNDDNIFLLTSMLRSNGYHNITSFSDSEQAYAVLQKDATPPDALLLDIMMPNMDGLDLCRRIRADDKFAASSVLFITARHGDDAFHDGYNAGAQDFLRKPFSKTELLCRLKSLFTIQDLNKHLLLKNQELTLTSITDGLTGLYNRTFFDKRLAEEFQRCQRYGQIMTLMMMDIDHFKRVNDTHGHPVGDEVLRNLSALLKNMVRGSDLLARYGGEELVLIVSATGLPRATEIADRIREEVAGTPLSETVVNLRITLSVGLAEFTPDMRTPENLLERADQALYAAKKAGRNLTKIWIST